MPTSHWSISTALSILSRYFLVLRVRVLVHAAGAAFHCFATNPKYSVHSSQPRIAGSIRSRSDPEQPPGPVHSELRECGTADSHGACSSPGHSATAAILGKRSRHSSIVIQQVGKMPHPGLTLACVCLRVFCQLLPHTTHDEVSKSRIPFTGGAALRVPLLTHYLCFWCMMCVCILASSALSPTAAYVDSEGSCGDQVPTRLPS